MIAAADFRKIAKARLKDAEVLLSAGRFDGAVYLCGYSVEIALKARICRRLKWTGFPSTNKDFEGIIVSGPTISMCSFICPAPNRR